jgi:hypothetical protein
MKNNCINLIMDHSYDRATATKSNYAMTIVWDFEFKEVNDEHCIHSIQQPQISDEKIGNIRYCAIIITSCISPSDVWRRARLALKLTLPS